jgi:hypothetical protein
MKVIKENKSLSTPILFIVFNRLDTTKNVFESIRKARPSKLYVAADGPRASRNGELVITKNVRTYIESNIDWSCEIKTFYYDSNQGCKRAVSSAIRWFFSQEEQGIVLEDDCIPSLSFYYFCQELLERYKNDSRIGMISGYNWLNTYPCIASYHFSTGGPIWGWASWKRVAESFDPDNPVLRNPLLRKWLIDSTGDTVESDYLYHQTIRNLECGSHGTWDFSWGVLQKINFQLAIVPANNLIRNIGYTSDATHAQSANSPLFKVPLQEIEFPLKHPEPIIADKRFSMQLGRIHCGPVWQRVLKKLPFVLRIYRFLANKKW